MQLFHHQIKTFLTCQSRNDTNDRNIVPNWQAYFWLKSSFVFQFPSQIIFVKVISQQFICFWIVDICINTIDNTDQLARLHPKNLIQTATKLSRPNFVGIARWDSCHAIRIKNTRLHPVEAVIPTESSVRITFIADTKEFPEHAVRKLSLKL